MRGGAIIPLALNQINNLTTGQITGIHMLCSPGSADFTLYEDDGVTNEYQKGAYLKTYITMTSGKCTVFEFKQEGNYQTAVDTMYLDVIQRENAPYWLSLDNERLPKYLHRKKFEEAKYGWYYSQTKKSVQIKYKNPKKDYKLVISFEQFDMIGM
jgi:alpha-glucosidase